MTAKEFEEKLGYSPEDDDLERVNCIHDGEPTHMSCGWCSEHDKPRFICGCFKRTLMTMPNIYEMALWHSMEELDMCRIIPYGIPRQIYFSMLSNQYFDTPITLFPEHYEYAK